MQVTGIKKSDFTGKDGTVVTGYDVYLSDDIPANTGMGQETQRVYMSDTKIAKNSIDINAIFGKEVSVLYNRFGKVERLEVLK